MAPDNSSSGVAYGRHRLGHGCLGPKSSISDERSARHNETVRNKPGNDERRQRHGPWPAGLPACCPAYGNDLGAQEAPGPSHTTVTASAVAWAQGTHGESHGAPPGLRDPRLMTVGLQSGAERCVSAAWAGKRPCPPNSVPLSNQSHRLIFQELSMDEQPSLTSAPAKAFQDLGSPSKGVGDSRTETVSLLPERLWLVF